MFNLSSSPIDRLLLHRRPVWATLIFCLLLIVMPLAAAYLDGIWTDYFSRGFWRISLLAPVEIIYILIIAPILARSDESVMKVFRSTSGLDDEDFNKLVYPLGHINPVVEGGTIFGGAILGLLSAYSWGLDSRTIWLSITMYIFLIIMYALLAWTIMSAIVGTRLISALHRQPLHFDIFDIKPFEPIGKQSLTVAMVFIGGITLGVIFTIQVQSLFEPVYWLANIPLVLVSILVFYLGMRPTHLLFEAKKNDELEKIRQHLRKICQRVVEGLDKQEDVTALSSQVNALAFYEQRLLEVRTWPYNFSMLRTLFVSVLIPGFTMLARVVADLLQE